MSFPHPLSSISITSTSLQAQQSLPQASSSPWKLSHVPARAALDYLKETQRYIRTIQDQPQAQSAVLLPKAKPAIREIVFPCAEPQPEKPKKPAFVLPYSVRSKLSSHKPVSMSDLSMYQSAIATRRSAGSQQSNYAVTRYMLAKPVTLRATIGFPARAKRGESEHRRMHNPHIDSFLNRFENRGTRFALPGIMMRTSN